MYSRHLSELGLVSLCLRGEGAALVDTASISTRVFSLLFARGGTAIEAWWAGYTLNFATHF